MGGEGIGRQPDRIGRGGGEGSKVDVVWGGGGYNIVLLSNFCHALSFTKHCGTCVRVCAFALSKSIFCALL